MAAMRSYGGILSGVHSELPEVVQSEGGSANLFPLLGVTPAFAALSLREQHVPRFPKMRQQVLEFLERRPDLAELVPIGQWHEAGGGNSHLLTLVDEDLRSEAREETEFCEGRTEEPGQPVRESGVSVNF